MAGFELPTAPQSLVGPVKAWSQPVTIPTYLPARPDPNPMFLDKRVYQGSSGRVYPLPFIDRIAEEKIDRSWEALHIENEHIRLMILPELGGRIHVGLDKHNHYDFFCRQNVIKPALVGLAGPWISGGVEFNWPQHHRPSTFMRADWHIENHPDGAITIWCSEHEPMNRMKGMHGICLHPGKSFIELKVRLYNRTELPQTFLWWANVGVRVHERYQSFFPPDVTFVADHARRAMSRFPLCDGSYYGVDYGRRAREGVPEAEQPRKFAPPPGLYPPNDLSWYANIPVPTSYMAVGSKEDFFGGYDHARHAGLIHIADHRIAPGKKQWTWGNHDFGYAWDRNLSDDEGPYIELMAGVFTDNQPDFSWLMPGETRAWSQYWYPIQEIGPAQKANVDAALSLNIAGESARIGIAVTSDRRQAVLRVFAHTRLIGEWTLDIGPARPAIKELQLPAGTLQTDLRIILADASGYELLTYQPASPIEQPLPPPAREPALPETVATVEDLYLIGVHLDQYRHATRKPDLYWREALRRDPDESRCNTALGWWHLRRGEFPQAATHFQNAIGSLTRYNLNPRDGEAHYGLGIALRHAGNTGQAFDAFAKAAWNSAWQVPAWFAMAQLESAAGRAPAALDYLDRLLAKDVDHLQARSLKAILLREQGHNEQAARLLAQTLQLDPLDASAGFLAGTRPTLQTQVKIDLDIDFARAGKPGIPTAPQFGDPDYCFPVRLEDAQALRARMHANPSDPLPPCLLGNWMYDRDRCEEAIALWEKSVKLNRAFSIPWRNLGIAYYNVLHDAAAARGAYQRALQAAPDDARLLYERDQLSKRTRELPRQRLEALEQRLDLVEKRDDLAIEYCTLLNLTRQHQRARDLLASRHFQPWEGGEGLVLGQWTHTHLALANAALRANDPENAVRLLRDALQPPPNLGEARHLLANQSDLHFALGTALAAAGHASGAREQFLLAAGARGDFQRMALQPFSEMTFSSALALRTLGREQESQTLLESLLTYACDLEKRPAAIDYFATSLPTMLLFEDDLQQRQTLHARFLAAQAHLGLGDQKQARVLLTSVIAEDPGDLPAADLLEFLGGDPGLSPARA